MYVQACDSIGTRSSNKCQFPAVSRPRRAPVLVGCLHAVPHALHTDFTYSINTIDVVTRNLAIHCDQVSKTACR